MYYKPLFPIYNRLLELEKSVVRQINIFKGGRMKKRAR